MKDNNEQNIIADADVPPSQPAQTINTRIGKLSFTHDFANGYPTKETVDKLYDERDFQRACQAYIWALPMVSIGELEEIYISTGASYGDVMSLHGFVGVSHMTTPNVQTPYVIVWFNLAKSGPFVVDLPAGATAGISMDMWQRSITDIGVPGPDQGKGGKYLFLGPGQEAPADVEGYHVFRSLTSTTMVATRLLAPDVEEQDRLRELVRAYPFSQRADPPKNKILKPGDDGRVNNAPRGMTYWEKLSRWINEEPVQERDRMMMAMLKPLGIEKGKSFNPDARQKKILTEAVLVGEAMAKANDYEKRDMKESANYADGSHWDYALNVNISQESEHYSQLDERAAWFYEACGMSVAMRTKIPGVGSIYLGTFKDKAGDWLDGANNYKLHVPPNAPVKQFWAVTIYSVDTRTFVENDQQIPERASRQPDLVKNADSSVDIYVGPKAPPAGFEKNWIPTVPGKSWFSYFRLYAPTETHFDGTWVLPDFEKVK